MAGRNGVALSPRSAATQDWACDLKAGTYRTVPGQEGFLMDAVKYRMHNEKLAPRRTRMEIPGWAGERQPRANGSREQVWHCVPFSEGAQYGIELFYPYANELGVTTK